MTTKYTTDGTIGTLTITYQYNRAAIEAVLVDACHWLFDGMGQEEGVKFEELTIEQLEKLLDEQVKSYLISAASTYRSLADQEAARNAAAKSAETTYRLGA